MNNRVLEPSEADVEDSLSQIAFRAVILARINKGVRVDERRG